MPSKKLMGSWVFVDFALLVAGVMTLVLSIIWRGNNILRNMVITPQFLDAGLYLGGVLLMTWAISIWAIAQPKKVTFGLKVLNWTLILDALSILVIGTVIWHYTLNERNNFHTIFANESPANQIAIQDQLQCCGYFNSTDLVTIGGSFCQNETFVQTTNNATGNFCVTPITAYADMTLNNIFTTIYGWMAIVVLLFLASVCMVYVRVEEERFRKIDEKRGGQGFV